MRLSETSLVNWLTAVMQLDRLCFKFGVLARLLHGLSPQYYIDLAMTALPPKWRSGQSNG